MKIDAKKLEKLFEKISYHRSAEGDQYFREVPLLEEAMREAKSMMSGLTSAEQREAFHAANGMRYLVMEYEFVDKEKVVVS